MLAESILVDFIHLIQLSSFAEKIIDGPTFKNCVAFLPSKCPYVDSFQPLFLQITVYGMVLAINH